MKKLFLALIAAAASLGLSAQTFYFDFGGTGGRGTLTTNPDTRGNHWNNIAPETEGATSIAAKTTFSNLVNSQGATTGVSLTLCNAWGVNSAGGLTSPKESLLGDLAVATATGDYMFNTNNTDGGRSFVIRGLDKTKGYRFTIFGTRSASDNREGLYTITGTNGWATMMKAAGSGIGHDGENQNTDNAPVSDIIYPDASGNITFYINHGLTTYIPLSCMKIETVNSSYTREGTVARTLLFDFGSNGTTASRGAQTTASGWNNIVNNDGNYCKAGTSFTDLVDKTGANTGFSLTVNERFTTNGGSGGGGLASPDASLLGDLGVATATNDYFFTETGESNRTMTFSGLNPNKAYRFYIFGTRSNAECRVGLYHIQGSNDSYGAQQVAGNAFTSAASQNTANILESAPIIPASDGTITITVINNAKTYVALSAMKIEELNGIDSPVRYNSATLSGSNLIAGEATTLHEIDRANWSVWAKLNAGTTTINVVDEFGATSQFTVTIPHTGIYRIDANLDDKTATAFECTYFCLQGSAWGGWSTTGQEMNYAGNGCWNFKGELAGYDKSTDPGRINFIMNKSWDLTYKRASNTKNQLALGSGDDIPLNPGIYDITVDLNNMTWSIDNGLEDLDPNRITVMGSSVANGQGAAQVDGYNQGYAHLFNNMLAERYTNNESENPFFISNISIGGNSSVNLLNRYDDLERDFGKYVIYGISLGNEGIHGAANQQAIYDQWLTNMQTLVSKARNDGKTVVVMNNYTRGDFVSSDYDYVKRMNKEIAAWDVPSVNLLGAIDDGAGKWADGYQNGDDIYHPNTDGHREFFYAMVPSMFDALASGKTPTMNRSEIDEPMILGKQATIEFTPEGTTHSFTLALTASMNKDGLLATVKGEGNHNIKVKKSGANYILLLDGTDVATVAAPALSRAATLDNIVLTHNYAAKTLALIVNGTQSTAVTTEFAPTKIVVGDEEETEADARTIGEMMFYRSSMFTANPLASTSLNKSSLELYAPLNNSLTGTLPNLAMSTNAAKLKDNSSTIAIGIIGATANPIKVTGSSNSITISAEAPCNVLVTNIVGAVMAKLSVDGDDTVRNLNPGIYFVNNNKVLVK